MTGGGEIGIGRAIRGAAPYADDAKRRREDADTAALVARIQAGEEEFFAALYERYFDRVYAYLRVLLKGSHEAEDAAQQVFVQVFEALPRYEQREQPFAAWLFTIARHYGIRQLRRSSRVDVVDPDDISEGREGAGGGRESPAGEEGGAVLNWISDSDLLVFIERLPAAQRQVLALRYLFGFRPAEIAEIIDSSPNHVSVLHYRALGFLRERLAAVGREPRGRRARPRMRRWTRHANVLRHRRFALSR